MPPSALLSLPQSARIVVVSDLQTPFHDQPAVDNLLAFIKDFEPDALVNVGDDIDSPQVSGFSKGQAGEFAATLQANADQCKAVHAAFREALGDKPYHISRSNHGDRLQRYIARYAPALADLRCLQLAELLGYDQLGITYHESPFEIAPGWVCCHGDEGNLSRIAGRTAATLAERFGVSVVCGHTHRAAVSFKSYGYGWRVTKSLGSMEVGHLMDLAQAEYLDRSGGWADWQSAFGILYVSGDRVSPVVIPVTDSAFMVDGLSYG